MSDLIERSEVLKQLRLNHKDVIYIDKVECARRIEAIPSARPKGEWIDNGRYLTCSECGIHVKMYWNFCPCCGTVMPTIRNINARPKDEPQTEYERASEQREHDILHEPTYNKDDGSM